MTEEQRQAAMFEAALTHRLFAGTDDLGDPAVIRCCSAASKTLWARVMSCARCEWCARVPPKRRVVPDRILRDGALPPRTAAELASQIAEALGAAHGRGVVPRDVKPQNVLLTASGEARVADFLTVGPSETWVTGC